ncbi:SDR family NAD(P)-dependent oxidoreductase [Aggregicoccus sp. 17bor-14]|uniref:SDR family NAD(P)-dependent oxidoreductase n=1 Tax=Myxococcaceae TaxID=31 RepID=UPI00129C182B|nr:MULTISPECIES: SDR family NAD(P)-dependent oxidoreductase [Myxococcaceae]MBF5045458.1 SDR family NAD(P)-dependent oxidoreductase [Simulacricoccus sp. 17bor-14]MRI91196.1 SDR family NAD(P)-dependent oxidoreductase [Aggregicoccus sp. 17bor-14]
MTTAPPQQLALVTGASRAEGLGYETCRQLAQRGLRVLLTARDLTRAQDLAARLQGDGLEVQALALDVTSDASVQGVAAQLEAQHGHLDVLVNNAGSNFDFRVRTVDVDEPQLLAALGTNLIGPWRVSSALLPLLRRSPHARIVNVSSEAGSFGAPYGMASRGETLGAYGVSKAALNAFTLKLAEALRAERILVNAVCPGFIASHPGTAELGARPVSEGAAGVVWAAMLPPGGPTGGFFRDGQPMAW